MATCAGLLMATAACGPTPEGPNAAATLTIVRGDGQIRFPTSRLPEDLVVSVVDGGGQVVRDREWRVEWTVESGGGVVDPPISFTGDRGSTSAYWSLGPTRGEQVVRASVESLGSARFTARAVDPGPIVFVSDRAVDVNPTTDSADVAGDIYVMRPDGNDVVQLTPQGSEVNWLASPTWSPSGDRVAFERAFLINPTNPTTRILSRDGIHILTLAAGTERRVTANGFGFGLIVRDPNWSPDGAEIAVSGFSLWTLDLGGAVRRQLTLDPTATAPAWSPDGAEVVFASGTGLWIDRPGASTGLRRLTDHFRDADPDWSPDGEWILFAGAARGGGIWTIRPDGSALRQVLPGEAESPTWAPDGVRFAAALRGPDGRRDVVIARVDGPDVTNLTAGRGDNWAPAWRR